jgi:AAA+ superfamily predicted ATPase
MERQSRLSVDNFMQQQVVRSLGKRRVTERQQILEPSRYKENGHEVRLGSSKVSRTFRSFAMDLAMYACQRLVLRQGATALVNFNDFTAPPAQEAISCDVDRSEAVFLNYYALLKDMIIACIMTEGGLMISCYGGDQKAALKFFEALDQEIEDGNIYRGKCLYFSSKRGIEFKETPKVAWDDVILSKALKDEILLHSVSFLSSTEAHEQGVLKRGLIFHGAPGTGKTTLVRALFAQLEGTDITRMYVTNEAFEHVSMDGFFSMIHYVLPAIVVFEDIDLIGPSRSIARQSVTGALLTQLDGVDKIKKPLVVIGTTNDLHSVDDALTNRPARFDRVLEIPKPTEPEIALFYKKAGFDVSKSLIRQSEGFTGAHISEVVKTAILMGSQAKKPPKDYLDEALKAVKKSFRASPGPSGFASKRDEPEFLGKFGLPGYGGGSIEEEPMIRPMVDPREAPNRTNVP